MQFWAESITCESSRPDLITSYFITRHPGAIEWAARKGIQVDRQIPHLDPEQLRAGDVVIGILPVNLAARVCQAGGHFFNLSVTVPLEMRGLELSADDLERYGASIEEYRIEAVTPESVAGAGL